MRISYNFKSKFSTILSIDDLKLYSNAISNLIAELFLLSVMRLTKKEASKILRIWCSLQATDFIKEPSFIKFYCFVHLYENRQPSYTYFFILNCLGLKGEDRIEKYVALHLPLLPFSLLKMFLHTKTYIKYMKMLW